MKIGIFTDVHCKLEDLEELNLVCDEIYSVFTKNKVQAIYCLGDSFHTINPSSILINFYATFLKRFGNIPIKIIAAQSHESKSAEENILTHFGILSNNIEIASEFYLKTEEGQKIFFGHFMVQESLCGFKEEKSVKEYKDYDFVFLGHQHTPQVIANNVYHLGSVRYINFSESNDKGKQVAIFDTEISPNQLKLIALTSIYPMIDVKASNIPQKNALGCPTINELPSKKHRGRPRKVAAESCKIQAQSTPNPTKKQGISDLLVYLDQIPVKSKVRVIFDNFKDFADYLSFEETYKNKFFVYKRETKFNIMSSILGTTKQDNLTMQEYFIKWIEEKKIEKDIADILLKELK